MRMPGSIRTRVMLVVLGFGLVTLLINALRNDVWLRERQWRRVGESADAQASMLAGTMQHYFRMGLARAAELQMGYTAMSDEVQSGVVLDADDVITYSLRLDWVGMKLADSALKADLAACAHARETMSETLELDRAGGKILAVYPFFTGYDSGGRGLVLLRYDMSHTLARGRWEALRETVLQSLLLGLLCLVLWTVLDRVITRRVQQIVTFARQVEAQLPGASALPEQDELALIAEEFARSVHALRSTESRLLEASEQERRRVGADLHDDVCQRITAAQLRSGVLHSMLDRESHPQAALAGSVAEELAKAARAARSFARGLAPMLVQRGRLAEALKDLAAAIADSFQLRCECECDVAERPLAVWVDTHVYRIVQELMINAAKHARPGYIQATVSIRDGCLLLGVENDGAALARSEGSGLGLQMVRQRARALGGRFSLGPREDGTGCKAVCEVRLTDLHYVDDSDVVRDPDSTVA